MIAQILTGLAGLALGIVVMRLWQMQQAAAALTAKPVDDVAPAIASETSTEASALAGEDSDPSPDDTASVVVADPSLIGQAKQLASRVTTNQWIFGAAAALLVAGFVTVATRSDDPAATGTDAPTVPGMAGAPGAGGAGQLDDVNTMIARLEARLQANPADGEGFRMLGWSYQNTGNPAKSLQAYQTAARLLPGRADVLAGYGEAMVASAGDRVTPEAKTQFEHALQIDPAEPRARFFMALYKTQNGQEPAGLEEWIALANSSAAELPWQADLRQRITQLAARINVNIAGRLTNAAPAAPSPSAMPAPPIASAPAAAPAAAGAGGDQQAMIDGMVNGLAARLATNPNDSEGWSRLIRSRAVLNDRAQAARDLATARRIFAGKPADLAKVNTIASELGL